MGSGEQDQIVKKGALKDQPKENLHLLLDTIDGINRTMELKSLLAESMEATRLVMNSEASSLMLLDEDTGELYVSLPTGPVKEQIKGMRIPKHQGIGGWVVENKKPFMSNDVENTEFFWGDLAEGFKTRNIVCVPLINKENRVIGVLQALNRRKGVDFTAKDIPVFQSLAAHVTLAIERARQIEKLHNQLKEKEVMITETHHRIKNNLAAISGLIELEMHEVEDEHARMVLKNTYSRIQSMTKVHDLLCQKGLFNDIELGLYVRQLTEKIQETMGNIPSKVDIALKADTVHVSANKALLCGLIINELTVNIYKHAFQGADDARIDIEITQDDQYVHIDLKDNGIGLPEGFDFENRQSIGMWVVNVLLKKLKGTIETGGNDGARFRIRFAH